MLLKERSLFPHAKLFLAQGHLFFARSTSGLAQEIFCGHVQREQGKILDTVGKKFLAR
ncbi:MAG: hypothetical protein M3Y27_03795 [Acidobacteriota bacterium]|nr:hypothetical protein [Acidobacteriota bacterium]